jgi:hypothetical protein
MQDKKYSADDSVSASLKCVCSGPGIGTSDSTSATPLWGRCDNSEIRSLRLISNFELVTETEEEIPLNYITRPKDSSDAFLIFRVSRSGSVCEN